MPNFSINFNDVQDQQAAVPPGLYSVVVDDVVMKQSADQTGYYLNWKLKITTPGESIDRSVFMMTSLKPNVLWRLKAVLRAMGVDPGQLDFQVDDETGTVLEPDFRNLVAVVKVINETYQNVVRDRVEDIYPMTDELANDVVSGPVVTPTSKPKTSAPGATAPATKPTKAVLR